MSLAHNIDFLRRLKKLNGVNPLGSFTWGATDSHDSAGSRLVEADDFGPNPGELRMFSFAPPNLPPEPALVVVLHGCTQNAAGYDAGAGWSMLAEEFGFVLLMPEQTRANNANGCFNWFVPDDITRGSGEARSIRQMIDHLAHQHHVDPDRIFVTGLSAGGAMTTVMLATYPEVFAGGAVIAGLPYGIARNVREALSGMSKSPARSARELGDLVRQASSHNGPWPKLSVWHGSADRTVHPGNGDQIVQQWLDLHRLPATPMSETIVDGHPRQVWWNADGETLVESYSITDMAHGTPLGLGANDQRYGAEGAFLIEAGISSSYHIAQFFGLTGPVRAKGTKAKPKSSAGATAAPQAPRPAAPIPNLPEPAVSHAYKAGKAKPSDSKDRFTARPGIDINAVITRALTAAGLMK